MRSSSGRVAIGLVLLSTWAGACLSEQNPDEVAPASAMEPQIASEIISANDVVSAVRTQLKQAFGQTNVVPNERTPRTVLNDFEMTGNRSASSVEFLGTSGNARNAAAHVALPTRANGMFFLQDVSSGLSVDVGLEGATDAAREEANGYVIYRGGYLQGAHIIHRATSIGTEDYVYFPNAAPEKAELRYRLKLGENVAGLRLIQQSIEMVDAKGAPRLRMNTPYAVDGDGRRLAMQVAMTDCAYDSSMQVPWGRTPVNPGARECTVQLSWPSDAKAPLVVDPMWTLTTDMHEIRLNATSVVTPIGGDSRVLVVGGDNATGAMGVSQTTEIYDEASNAWTFGPMLTMPRTDHAMVVLGAVPHVIGGRNSNGLLASSEKLLIGPNGLYWQVATGNMMVPRARPAAIAYDSNNKIFVSGGFSDNEAPLSTVEVYDKNTGWVMAQWPPMKAPRAGHAMVAVPPTLSIGAGVTVTLSVLLMGGKSEQGFTTNKVERCFATNAGNSSLYCTLQLDSMNATPPMAKARMNHVAVYDEDTKKVLVFGGDALSANGVTAYKTVEIYDPMKPDAWVEITNSPMQSNRSFFTVNAVQPLSSKYFVIGGFDFAATPPVPVDTVDIYDAKKMLITGTQSMEKPRGRHSTVLLSDLRPLVIGGALGDVGTAEFMSCTSDDNCAIYYGGKSYCSKEGTCVPQKMPGAQCDLAADCLNKDDCTVCVTGECSFDGVCCDKACDGICESCKQPGSPPGLCLPMPPGPPVPTHGECLPDMHETKDLPCKGRCDGITRNACEYLEGKTCGSTCANNMDDKLLPSTKTELVCNLEGFCVEGEVSTTCGEYICLDTTSCRVDCKVKDDCLAGNLCSNGKCIPGQTTCGDADGLQDNVVVSTIPGIADKRCEPYRCENGACKNVCETAYDCLPKKDDKGNLVNYACDENRTCVPVDVTITETEASCSTAPLSQSSRFGWLAAMALAGLVAARRNRARA